MSFFGVVGLPPSMDSAEHHSTDEWTHGTMTSEPSTWWCGALRGVFDWLFVIWPSMRRRLCKCGLFQKLIHFNLPPASQHRKSSGLVARVGRGSSQSTSNLKHVRTPSPMQLCADKRLFYPITRARSGNGEDPNTIRRNKGCQGVMTFASQLGGGRSETGCADWTESINGRLARGAGVSVRWWPMKAKQIGRT